VITPGEFMTAAHEPDSPRRGPWFAAGYGGECSGCGEEILEGDQIRADGEGGWLDEDCGVEDEDVTPYPAPRGEQAQRDIGY
jgi:hypothetical protein